MANYRTGRVAQEILKSVTEILRDEVGDPRVKGVTLTDVEVTNDLQQAKIYYSTLEEEESAKINTQKGLDKATGLIRKLLGEQMTTYHTPELIFKRDESIEYGNHIEQILKSLHKNEK